MAKQYNMEIDKLKEVVTDAEKENIKNDLAIQKTVKMLTDNAVVKEKKKTTRGRKKKVAEEE